MRYNQQLINKIRKLRSQGLTYSEVNNRLAANIPKSTLTYICKDISLDMKQKLRINNIILNNISNARQKALIKNKSIIAEKYCYLHTKNMYIKDLFNNIDINLIALAMLYLGEGSKRSSFKGLSLGSSDYKIIQTYLQLLKICYSIERTQVRCRVQHRADQDSAELVNYWSKILNIPESNFYKCHVDKRSIGKTTKKSDYHGVCVVTCAGAHIQLELEIIADIINEAIWGVSSVG